MKFLSKTLLLISIFLCLSLTTAVKIKAKQSAPLAKGWLNYFVYYPKTNSKQQPKAFFINPVFSSQSSSSSESDQYGALDIPDQHKFFVTLTVEGIFVSSTRKNAMANTVDVVYLSSLAQQTSSENCYVGGVENQGDFREGYCFRLVRPTGGH